MSKKEIDKLEAQIKAYGQKVSSSKKKSESFLVEIGVINKDGKISKHYQNLCTQQEPV
ncbi:MAG: hypothetical protein GXX78_16545 [Bacteroidales bacterium]|nr:hypothetical protein [Bacteroidales bacterium]